MGSMFDEIKKLKKSLENSAKNDSLLNRGAVSSAEVSSPTAPNYSCPTCGISFAAEHFLNKHLVREHGISKTLLSNESTSKHERKLISKVAGSIDTVIRRNKLGQRSHVMGDQNNRGKGRQDRQKQKKLEGVDHRTNLGGFVPKVITLPDGQSHVVFKRVQGIPKSKPTSTSPARPPISSKPAITGYQQAELVQPPASAHQRKEIVLSLVDMYKLPDPWVARGKNTTLWESGKPFSVRMGIDFGTAFTKASVGFGDDIYIVDWDGIMRGKDKFTLPGEFSEMLDGSCVIGRSNNAKRVATDLKLPFLEHNPSHSSLVDASIFLALIMRYIRGWWFFHHEALVKSRAIEWSVNIGAPTTPWENDTVRGAYESVARAGWTLSCGSGEITVRQAEEAFNISSAGALPVQVIPEFVAQIASYTRSPQRQSDLHLLVDVGAGTVDVVTFNVHQDAESGEDIFPIFAASVSNLGTHYLMSKRFELLSQDEVISWSDSTGVMNAKELAEEIGVSISKIEATDRLHSKAITKAVESILKRTKASRYPTSQNWKKGIRTFLCGGGSNCSPFSQFLGDIKRPDDSTDNQLSRIAFPLPERLKAPSLVPEYFHRVSVAYGLGMDAFNLGVIRSIGEVPNFTQPKLGERQSFDWHDG